MAFDQHKNLAIASVANSPGAAGTTLTVAGGEGARFPAVPFNATVWPATELPTPVTAEVVRVTAIAADSFTITRSQEGTTARAIVAGDLIAATITAKTITDIESGVNFPQLATTGNLVLNGADGTIRTDTVDGADNKYILVNSSSSPGPSRGAYLAVYGNEVAGAGGTVSLSAGMGVQGLISLNTGGLERGRIHPSGGFSWGGTVDPGAGNLSVAGELILDKVGGVNVVHPNTPDGADTAAVFISGGGGAGPDATRGAFFGLRGCENAGPGNVQICAGVPTGNVDYFTNNLTRGRMHAAGGFSWGSSYDPGAGAFMVGGPLAAGSPFVYLSPNGLCSMGVPGTAYAQHMTFQNANAVVGVISSTGSTTNYGTTSDARLKTPLSRHTDPSVLRDTVIHNFVWKSDGTQGRGVFAQEAVHVLPLAVSVGTDDVDESGRLTKPWGVDYSKYVPDLITGWQAHDDTIWSLLSDVVALRARVAFLEGAVTAIRNEPRPSLYQRIRAAMAVLFPAWITP